MIADGCHVFAGGFSFGVMKEMTVPRQLEVHGLGRDTAKSAGLDFIEAGHWEDWPDPTPKACMLFGNPRCTGFSCVTGGHGEETHGAWSKPTVDIHQLCHYGVHHGYPIICWESVQQAMSTGRPLLDYLRDKLFVPNGYRIAHLLLNAASFGNSQHRKRYFFFAYKADKNFNIVPPVLPERHKTVGDVLLTEDLLNREVESSRFGKKDEYHADCYMKRCADEEALIPYLPHHVDLNMLARYDYEKLESLSAKYAMTWRYRNSDMPFSMHSIIRLDPDGPCPVISSSAGRFIHPTLDRPLTMRELALLMGWPSHITPLGYHPIGQIGKGICPEVGTWLAQQAKNYVNDIWGKEDWESSYDELKGEWVGRDYTSDEFGPPEKTFDLTTYSPAKPIIREREERIADVRFAK